MDCRNGNISQPAAESAYGMDKDWLRKQLKDRGRGAQMQLAEALGLHPTVVNKLVNGTRKISSDEADKIRAWLKAPAPDNQPTPKNKTQRVFISHSGDSAELAARLLNKVYELPATSDEKASVITVLQWLKKG
jgi:transcriptional regulator with XRE-family HTH domain